MVIRMKNTDPELARLAVRVGKALLRSERSVATAESCTGGWIAKAMTDIAGSSQWFIEGFVTYSNESKARRLGVPMSVLNAQGAVSEAVARAMALGALRRSGAQVAVAVTESRVQTARCPANRWAPCGWPGRSNADSKSM